MVFVRLILLLAICVTGFVTVECQGCTCSNGAGYCDTVYTSPFCYITTNDVQLIKTLLSDCASSSASYYYIRVYKNHVSDEYANLLIDIELPPNIQTLYIYKNRNQDHIRLTTSSQNTQWLKTTVSKE